MKIQRFTKLSKLLGTILLLSGGTSFADNKENTYYKVTGLQQGGHLNVRSEPSETSDDIGDLASGSHPWQVFETDASGQWGRIVWQEGNGWVALRYMAQIKIEDLADTIVPVGLACAGSEPFWLLEIESQNRIRFSVPDSSSLNALSEITQTTNDETAVVAISSLTESSSNTAVIRKSQCSDGKTESDYGWSADVITQSPMKLYSGCCFLRLPIK